MDKIKDGDSIVLIFRKSDFETLDEIILKINTKENIVIKEIKYLK